MPTPPAPTPDGLRRCEWADSHPALRDYHDTEWGVVVHGERALFERLTLEAFQSGLSWLTILLRREGFRAAFAGFDADTVAAYDAGDIARLLGDARIIRNRAKIAATIANAKAVIELREQEGLDALLWSFRPQAPPAPRTAAEVPTTSPESVAMARELKQRGFSFVGPTTAHALMEATGMVDTHLIDCHRRGAGR